ncbi:MAG: hypothetical protein ACRC4N_04110 [Gammaproteobacteria bacterium]
MNILLNLSLFFNSDGQKPSVFIHKPDLINKDHVSLVCEVTSSNLGNVYIMWKVGDEPYIEGTTSAPIHQNNYMFVLSLLTISKEKYENNTITCAVKHANMDHTGSPLQASTSQSKQAKFKCYYCTSTPKLSLCLFVVHLYVLLCFLMLLLCPCQFVYL